jgi:hypothetical protein
MQRGLELRIPVIESLRQVPGLIDLLRRPFPVSSLFHYDSRV